MAIRKSRGVSKEINIRGAKLVVISKSGSRNTCHRPIRKLVHLEIDYKSKESVDEEKDEVNEDEVKADKGHKSDVKSTRKPAIEGQYNRRLKDKYG